MNRKEQLIKDLLEGTLIKNIEQYDSCAIKLIVTDNTIRVKLLEDYKETIDLILIKGKVTEPPGFYEEIKDSYKMLHNMAINEALDKHWDPDIDNILNSSHLDFQCWVEEELTPIEIVKNVELILEERADKFIKEKEGDEEYAERGKKHIDI